MLKINPESTLAKWCTSRPGLQQQVKEEQQLGSPERAQSHTQMPVPAVHFWTAPGCDFNPTAEVRPCWLEHNRTWPRSGSLLQLQTYRQQKYFTFATIFHAMKLKKKSWSSHDPYVPSASLALGHHSAKHVCFSFPLFSILENIHLNADKISYNKKKKQAIMTVKTIPIL